MYSNRRRSHVHFIHQYYTNTKEYTGTRIVVFWEDKGIKEIKDIHDFKTHKYENPKFKNNKVSKWIVVECPLKNLVKKEMINESIDGKYRMIHVLYESINNELENYIDNIVKLEMNKLNNF